MTDEGAALRMGHYKLLLNHVMDGWFSPAVNSEDRCICRLCRMYNFEIGIVRQRLQLRYFFNVVDDPTEKHNLIGREDQKERVASMITRAKEIIERTAELRQSSTSSTKTPPTLRQYKQHSPHTTTSRSLGLAM